VPFYQDTEIQEKYLNGIKIASFYKNKANLIVSVKIFIKIN